MKINLDLDPVSESLLETAAGPQGVDRFVKSLIKAQLRVLTINPIHVREVVEGRPDPITMFGVTLDGWAPSPSCLRCGEDKGDGRLGYQTCTSCGQWWSAMIKGEVEFEPTITCGECEETKPPTSQLTCNRCSRKYRAWKAGAR